MTATCSSSTSRAARSRRSVDPRAASRPDSPGRPTAGIPVWRDAVANEGTVGKLVGYDLTQDKAFALTRGQFNDFSPTFTPDGKYLCFLSSRTIDPSYDELGST